MSDVLLRGLERSVAEGDYTKRQALARALERQGRSKDAVSLYLELLREDPTNSELMQEYVGAGGYCPMVCEDEVLGSSVRHQNLVVGGECLNVVVGDGFLERGDSRRFDDWKRYVAENKNGVSILPIRAEGAIKLGMFGFVDVNGVVHPAFRDVVNHYVVVHRNNETSWPLYGQLTYGEGTSAVLEEFTLDGLVVSRALDVPFLNDNCAVLAGEQGVLREVAVPERVKPLFASFFGPEFEGVVQAFQYFTARANNNFSEVLLWAPARAWRRNPLERALVLGRDVYYRFVISCGDGYGRPAVGWRSYAKNFP